MNRLDRGHCSRLKGLFTLRPVPVPVPVLVLHQRSNPRSHFTTPRTPSPFHLCEYHNLTLLARPSAPPCPMQKIDHIPRFIHDKHMFQLWYKVQSPREERCRDHHMGRYCWIPTRSRSRSRGIVLIFLVRRRRRIHPHGPQRILHGFQEPFKMLIRPPLPLLTRPRQCNTLDPLPLQIRRQIIHPATLVTKHQNLAQLGLLLMRINRTIDDTRN